jgi:hypothetical protein
MCQSECEDSSASGEGIALPGQRQATQRHGRRFGLQWGLGSGAAPAPTGPTGLVAASGGTNWSITRPRSARPSELPDQTSARETREDPTGDAGAPERALAAVGLLQQPIAS